MIALGFSLVAAPALADAAPAPNEDPAATEIEDSEGVEAAPADSSEDPASDEPASDEPASDADTQAPEQDATTEDAADDAVASDEPGPEEGPTEGPEQELAEADPKARARARVEADAEPDAEPIRPPRFDGPYIGVLALGTANFASVLNHDTPSPLLGAGGFLQAGDAVFPWMSIGVSAGGQAAWVGDQQMFEGALLVEFGFVPMRRHPLSIRAGFGFGGGALTEAGIDERSGFGGALFKGALRYEFFPLAEQKRPDRGGGWAIGPELGWLGATPAGKGQPFVNTILLGLSTSFYFGS